MVHRELYSELFSTLIHQFNNAIDHGIENPDIRKFNHKDEDGLISIDIHIQKTDPNEFLIIKITDDGAGIDPNKIREILRRKNMDLKNNNFSDESDEDIIQHIFDSQFSTKDEVNIVSGRGIGMNAILHAAYNLGGTAFVKTEVTKGTELWIRVPYKKESFKLAIAS